jgi:hypothetical protein
LYSVTPSSPDLAPSDFHLFGALKNAACSVKFKTDDVISAVRIDYMSMRRNSTDREYMCLFLVSARL